MKTKILSCILVLLLCLFVSSCNKEPVETTDPNKEETEQDTSNLLEFELSKDGESYILSGVGDCKNKDITIPSKHKGLPVTKIGASAFAGCEFLIRVTIPEGVTKIESRAFDSCINLERVNLPDSMESIGGRAFYGCHALTEIHIPYSVASLGANAFGECECLQTITYDGAKIEWDTLHGSDSIGIDDAFCFIECYRNDDEVKLGSIGLSYQ